MLLATRTILSGRGYEILELTNTTRTRGSNRIEDGRLISSSSAVRGGTGERTTVDAVVTARTPRVLVCGI